MNLRDQILAADDLPLHELYIPEWKVTVYVATMDTKDRGTFEKWVVVDKLDFARERLVILTACDKEGNKLFTEADLSAIGKKNAIACDRIFELALTVNALRKEEIAELKKTSETTLSEGSSSNSHSRQAEMSER